MTRALSTALLVTLLAGSVALAVFDREPRPQLGHGDHVPSVAVGFEAVDHVATHPPGTKQRVKVRAASASTRSGAVYPTDELLHALAMCETGGTMDQRATSATGRYLSFFQWALSTWLAAGGTGDPRDVSYEIQREIARNWVLVAGWSQWPLCSKRIGAR